MPVLVVTTGRVSMGYEVTSDVCHICRPTAAETAQALVIETAPIQISVVDSFILDLRKAIRSTFRPPKNPLLTPYRLPKGRDRLKKQARIHSRPKLRHVR